MKHLDKLAYIFLYLGLAVGLVAIWGLRFESMGQFLVILALVVFYFIWGIITLWPFMMIGVPILIMGFWLIITRRRNGQEEFDYKNDKLSNK